MNLELNKIYCGDCLEVLKTLPDDSVDSVVTDPPYGLVSIQKRFGKEGSAEAQFGKDGSFKRLSGGFMGKLWDGTGIENNVEMWKECLRVLKPGGHLLSFGGTRTYHRMAVAIEDAGFEVKNMIAWCYGQGFPKSLRVGCNCDRGMLPYNNDKVSLSSEEKLLDVPQGVSVSKQVSSEKKQGLLKEVRGTFNIKNKNWDKEETARDLQTLQERVLPEMDSESEDSLLLAEMQRDSKVGTSKKVLGKRQGNKKSEERIENGKEPSVERGSNLLEEARELQADKVCEVSDRVSVNGSERQLHNGTSLNNGDALETDIDEDRGSASHQSRPARQQDRESDVISEQSGTQTTRREICKKCGGVIGMEGYGTALKPAIEPICMAMKPISEKTIRLNVLKWGCGGINIDESRVGVGAKKWSEPKGGIWNESVDNGATLEDNPLGRFPANLIHDNSEEVRECFPNAGKGNGKGVYNYAGRQYDNKDTSMFNGDKPQAPSNFNDSGNASRFFKSIIYQAKASKSERNTGLDVVEESNKRPQGEAFGDGSAITEHSERKGNFHPTVKPIALMEYLIKMVTPKSGIVLDPFAGSGSTLIAAKKNGFNFIGIEKEEEYIKISQSRINAVPNQLLN